MRCRQAKAQLGEYIAGTLPQKEAMQITSHLRHCRTCRVEWQRLRQVEALLHRSQPLTAPPSLTDQIMAAVAEQRRKETERLAERSAPPSRSYWRAVWLGAVVAILATLVVAALVVIQPGIAFQEFNGVPEAMTAGSDFFQVMQMVGTLLIRNQAFLIAMIVVYAGAVVIWLHLMRHSHKG